MGLPKDCLCQETLKSLPDRGFMTIELEPGRDDEEMEAEAALYRE
jgi:hypothetical protein